MSRVKVALIHNIIAPYRHPLFEMLSKNIDLVVYYCSNEVHPSNWDSWPRVYYYAYKLLRRVSIKTPIDEFYFNPTIIVELVKQKPDLMIINGYTDLTTWVAFFVAHVLRIPVIHWTEGTKEPESFLGLITKPLRIFLLKAPDAIVVPGKKSENYVASLGIKKERIFIAPNAIDNELFLNTSIRCPISGCHLKSQLGITGRTVVLFVGQLIERKGLKYLFRAYSKIEKERDDTALLVLGKGPLEPELRNLASQLKIGNLSIIQPGLSLEQIINLYSVADIFVLPTLDDVWGFVINEAMICGLPVVSTYASQAACEMVRSGINGYVVKEASSEKIYVALKTLICNVKRRKEMGQQSRDIVSNEFDVRRMTDGFLSAIKYCLRKAQK